MASVRTGQRLAVVGRASHTATLSFARGGLSLLAFGGGGGGRENELTARPRDTTYLVRQAASEMRTIRSLTRKSDGIHAGKRCMTMTVAGWSKAVKSAAL